MKQNGGSRPHRSREQQQSGDGDVNSVLGTGDGKSECDETESSELPAMKKPAMMHNGVLEGHGRRPQANKSVHAPLLKAVAALVTVGG